MRKLVLILATLWSLALVTSSARAEPKTLRGAQRSTLAVPTTGLSGLSVDQQGVIWSVPERQRLLVPLKRDKTLLTPAGPPVPIENILPKYDTESLTWLPDGRLALGTETRTRRTSDAILLARRDGDVFRVEKLIELPYEYWKIEPHPNKGIEGLCFASGHLVAGLERDIAKGKVRHAPVAVYDMERERWTPLRLRLTSRRGKLAGLTCRATDGGIEVRAIERHFGTSHLLGFQIALPPTPGEIEPELLGSLHPPEEDETNYEGITWLPNGDLVAVSDNHYSRVTGPTAVVILPNPAAKAAETQPAGSD